HDERQLDLAFRSVDFHVVFDLHARGTVARNELLSASLQCRCHVCFSCPEIGANVQASQAPGPPLGSLGSQASNCSRPCGARFFMMSCKLIAISCCARRIRYGAGWLGSFTSKYAHTLASMAAASSRDWICASCQRTAGANALGAGAAAAETEGAASPTFSSVDATGP